MDETRKDAFLRRLSGKFLQSNSPLKLQKRLRNNYLYESYKRESFEPSVGVTKNGVTIRFLVRGEMKQYIEDICVDLQKNVTGLPRGAEWDCTWPPGTDRATALIRWNFDIEDESSWNTSQDIIVDIVEQYWKYFTKHRQEFRTGTYRKE